MKEHYRLKLKRENSQFIVGLCYSHVWDKCNHMGISLCGSISVMCQMMTTQQGVSPLR